MDQFKILRLHVLGYVLIVFHVIAVSVLCLWALQFLAMAHGEMFDWGAVLRHLVLSLTFLVFFPGQTLWTYRMRDADGRIHTIVGRPPEHDLAED